MPIFQYECSSCHHSEEHLFSVSSRPDFISCVNCQSPAKFTLSPTHFIINGASVHNGYSGESNFKWIGDDSKPLKK